MNLSNKLNTNRMDGQYTQEVTINVEDVLVMNWYHILEVA